MYTPAVDSQLFSLARSPAEPARRGGFWLGRPAPSGAVSLSGGYAPETPAWARGLGTNSGPSWMALKTASSPPSEQLSPLLPLPLPCPFPWALPNGQPLVSLLRTGPETAMDPARPKGPPQPFGGSDA